MCVFVCACACVCDREREREREREGERKREREFCQIYNIYLVLLLGKFAIELFFKSSQKTEKTREAATFLSIEQHTVPLP